MAAGLWALSAGWLLGGDFLVSVWQSENGLPGNAVRAAAQASDGYLWVATAEGIARFDGREFVRFPVEPDATLALEPSHGLFPMPWGDVWVATARGGLLRWREGRLRRIWEGMEGSSGQQVGQVVATGGERVLIARGDQVWECEGDGVPMPRAADAGTLDLLEKAASEAARRGIVAAGQTGARLVDRKAREWLVDGDGLRVAGGSGEAGRRVDLSPLGHGLSITCLHGDREGNVWVCTAVNGLARVRESRVEVVRHPGRSSDPAVLCLMEDRQGFWWYGCRRGGVDRVAPDGVLGHLDFGAGSRQRRVSVLFEDREGVVWVASLDGRVYRFDGTELVPLPEGGRMPSKVRAIAQGTDGRLWFGGGLGLASLSSGAAAEASWHGPRGGVMIGEVCALAVGKDGALYAGTSDGRLYRGGIGGFDLLDGGGWFRQRPISGLSFDEGGRLWVTTLGAGLVLWDGRGWSRFAEAQGLPDTRLTCLLDPRDGFLWLGSLGGILRVAKSDLRGGQGEDGPPLPWLRLDRADGLPSRECMGSLHPAGWVARDGSLLFPQATAAVRVDPRSIEVQGQAPVMVLRQCQVNGRLQEWVTPPKSIETGPGTSRLSFSYTGISLSAPEKVRYRVRLAGLDEDWRDVGGRREAFYDAVPPGRYRFEVQALNGDGVASRVALLPVRVREHFWQSGWFLGSASVLTVAAAAGAGWTVSRRRMRRRLAELRVRHAREGERARIARDLHDDLGSGLTEVALLAGLSAERARAGEDRGMMEQIAAKTKTLLGALDEIVWAANPREDTVRSLADYLAGFASEFLGSAGIALRLDLAADLPTDLMEPEARHSVFLAVREALNNVVKHSGAREAGLAVRTEGDCLVLVVADRGRGFRRSETKEGDGLANMHQRLQALGGSCKVTSSDGAGTEVRFALPFRGAGKVAG